MSQIESREPPLGVNNDFPDAYLFHIEMIPRWSEHISEYLRTKQPGTHLSHDQQTSD